ncbi:LysR family transcriptional regulator [Jeotgalibacillus sp. JSM ZJ347]|uniref:LysR family transcriptional regulator n=1 Tax=Jeotgalibacillus sp. JSM ZJ347 TaxID=3342117 RepID=UPI0035A9547D
MNIDNLRMFCLVADEGSVSQAARLSYISQPAVTKKIRQLENRYGASLFNRSDGRLTLSKAGKVLYPYAKNIVELDSSSFQVIKEVSGLTDLTLNVGASQTIGEYLLPNILGDYKKKYEETMFSLLIGNTPYVLSKLDENEIDIALVEGEVDHSKYSVRKFADDELILITSYHHQWKDRESIGVHELSEEKMIWREKNSGTRLIVENALKDCGVLERIENAMELGSIQSIKSAIEVNLGIGIIPRLTVTKELQFNILREVRIKDFNITRNLWVVQKEQRFKKSTLTNFENFLLI